ncbi:hypothetical protein [Rhizomonospora bruguierae]|uniref:hypothetical protein n=1 Tax=Rhizomonospora bruguierae TaxID=1581705 RepID=UPI001BCE0186|nr:hypothetical protein [Micromonospora sp. NBRC 107566]
MAGTPDLMDGLRQLREAAREYQRADAFYYGRTTEAYASVRVQMLLAKQGVNNIERFDYAHIPVDTIANRLRIRSIAAVPEEPDVDGDGVIDAEADEAVTAAQAALDRTWERNQLDAEAPDAILKACRNGDAYLFVWPVTVDGGADDTVGEDGDPPSGQVVDVDVRVNGADTVRAVYRQDDPLTIDYVIKSWTFDEPGPEGQPRQRARATLYYPPRGGRRARIERWISQAGCDASDSKNWDPFDPGDGRGAAFEHDHGMPWFHLRTDRPYGKPDHLHAYGPQQMIDKLVIAHASSIDYQSFPQRVALMDPKADDVLGNRGDPFRPEDEDDDPEGGGTSALSADPSSVWKIPGVRDVKQLDPADPSVFLAPFDRYVQAMGEATQVALYRFGSRFAQTPSGAALRMADAPTDNTALIRHELWGGVIADAFEQALRLLGIEGARVEVKWAPVASVTDLEGWQVIQAKITAGVPAKVALMEAGYTAEQAADWTKDWPDPGIERRLAVVVKLGDAVQRLGAGVSLGVISEAIVGQLVRWVVDPRAAGGEEMLTGVGAPQLAIDANRTGQEAGGDTRPGDGVDAG